VSKAAIIRSGIEKILRELPIEEDPAMSVVGLEVLARVICLKNTTNILPNTAHQRKNESISAFYNIQYT